MAFNLHISIYAFVQRFYVLSAYQMWNNTKTTTAFICMLLLQTTITTATKANDYVLVVFPLHPGGMEEKTTNLVNGVCLTVFRIYIHSK